MATFTNRAQLLYNNTVINSNIAVGEISETLVASKTSLTGTYTADDSITYIIGLSNSGTNAVTNVTVTDDLGGYLFNGTTLYPLTYTEGSAKLFQNGIPAGEAQVTATPSSLVISNITVPALGNVQIIYEATTNEYAPLDETAEITNTATVTTTGDISTLTTTATVTVEQGASLTLTKTIDPVPATQNGQIVYTITVINSGNSAVEVTDNAVITDTLDPVLTAVTATLNGAPLAETTGYTYDEATGVFSTVQGVLNVPAATYTQNEDGSWTVVPGTSTLVISGTL